jgi:unsaturated rhamnogalacturonyl hydrolase
MTTLTTLPLAAFFLAAPLAAAPAPASPPPASQPAASAPTAPVPILSVTVTNPLAAPRAKETIALTIADLAKLAPGFDAKQAVVTDAAGKAILSQLVDLTGDETPDEIVFQTDLGPKESKTFKVKAGTRTPAARDDYKVYGRFVRERHDDFAWENDRLAHRMYGPDLETCPKEPLTSSGVDVWVKRVSKLVVNDWYMTDNYHQDMGEGADFYGVGKSRGLGGLGVWASGKLAVSKNFVTSRVLANGPIRLVFELDYAPWQAGSERVAETKRVILDAGSQWNRFESTFTGQKGKLAVGIGIAKHPGSTVKVDARGGSMRVWEPLDGGKAGNLGTAIVLPAGAKLEAHHSDLDYLIVTPVLAGGRLVYYAGSAWDRAGHFRDQAAWTTEVQRLSSRIASPVKVKLAVSK